MKKTFLALAFIVYHPYGMDVYDCSELAGSGTSSAGIVAGVCEDRQTSSTGEAIFSNGFDEFGGWWYHINFNGTTIQQSGCAEIFSSPDTQILSCP